MSDAGGFCLLGGDAGGFGHSLFLSDAGGFGLGEFLGHPGGFCLRFSFGLLSSLLRGRSRSILRGEAGCLGCEESVRLGLLLCATGLLCQLLVAAGDVATYLLEVDDLCLMVGEVRQVGCRRVGSPSCLEVGLGRC